jgi:hypothetical protein
MRDNWLTLFIISVVGVALWLALTVPDVEDIEITEKDWGL